MTLMADAPVQVPTIDFLAPIPGLAAHTRFELVSLDDDGVLYSLRCSEDPSLRLILVAPGRFFPDYAPLLDDETAAALELTTAEDAAVFVVVNPGAGLADATANLLAPVVLNHRTARATQALLTGTDLPVRAPLVPNR